MKTFSSICLLIWALAFSLPAQAKGIPLYFGESDALNKIEGVAPINIDEDTYTLGYRTYFKWFLAGVYVADEGYVLIDNADDGYIPLDDEKIQILQEEGLVVTPLPDYKLTGMDYLKGYSLWLIIVALGLYFGVKMRPKNAATQALSTDATEPADPMPPKP